MLKTKGLISVTALIVITGALGGISGRFLGSMFKPLKALVNDTVADYPVEYSKNQEAATKLFSAANVNSPEELAGIDVSKLIGKNGLTVADVAECATYFLFRNENLTSKSYNYSLSTTMGINNKQETNSTWIKNKDLYFKENMSYSSNASFGERMYNCDDSSITFISKPLENKINYYRQTGVKSASKSDFSNPTKSSYYQNVPEGEEVDENGNKVQSFRTTFQTSVFTPFNYQVNEKYALKDDNGGYSTLSLLDTFSGELMTFGHSIEKIEAGYKISLTIKNEALDQYGAYVYLTTRDSSKIAKMKQRPGYLKVGWQLFTDNKLDLKKMKVYEHYNVYSAIVDKVPTDSTSEIYFYYGSESSNVPSIKEVIQYERPKW